MATSNIANATGPSMNWVDERNASAQSRCAQDATDWAQTLFDAARSHGYEASLTAMGSGDCGAPVLNICNHDPALDGIHVSAEPVQPASSAYPFQPLPAGVLSPDPAVQAWYESILAAVRRIDPNATIDNSIGIARVLVNGQQTILTGQMYDEFAQGYATPEQQVNRAVTGTPVALTPEQQLRLAQYQVQSPNRSLSILSPADSQRQFDVMCPSSSDGVPAGNGGVWIGQFENSPDGKAWLDSILAAAKAIDPAAAFSRTPEGGTQLTAAGKTVRLGPGEMEQSQFQDWTPADYITNRFLGQGTPASALAQQNEIDRNIGALNRSFETQSPDSVASQYANFASTINGVPQPVRFSLNNSQNSYGVSLDGKTLTPGPISQGLPYTVPASSLLSSNPRTPQASVRSIAAGAGGASLPSLALNQSGHAAAGQPALHGAAASSPGLQAAATGIPAPMLTPAGPSSTPGPRLVTYADGMQGYVGPDGKIWRDSSPITPAWGTTPTPFD